MAFLRKNAIKYQWSSDQLVFVWLEALTRATGRVPFRPVNSIRIPLHQWPHLLYLVSPNDPLRPTTLLVVAICVSIRSFLAFFGHFSFASTPVLRH